MHSGNILIADLFPLIINIVFVLAVLRFFVIVGLALVLILTKGLSYKPYNLDSNTSDRISSFSATEVNFSKLLTDFSEPFSLNKVY